ncbi:MAG: UDP-N-acetylmuramate dehydrogenase [Evtepia gabavorous]|uniref:UDP-N-acetylmuramate dehydrogenase n=1 Tax=Evtepia gabavorous TaxID=2211183 RepID=UPI00399A2EB3
MEELKVLQSKLKAQLPDLELREQEPMRLHTTFRVGGPASLMALPRREADLGQLLRMAFQAGVTPFFLGKGSNLLVADEGVDRFLIKLAGGLNRLERAEGTAIYVGSGVTLAQAAVFAAHHGLTGLEFAHGIPGTMGGGVFMNAGAYEGEMAQVVDWVDCLDEEGMPRRLSREALALGYRSSIFLRRPWLITGAHLTLAPGDPAAIRRKMADLSRRRRAKQPLGIPAQEAPLSARPGILPGFN